MNSTKSINEKYLHALSLTSDWLTVSEWAMKVADTYPELLENAEKQSANQKNDTTGLREIAARLSSRISSNPFGSQIGFNIGERKMNRSNLDNTTLDYNVAQPFEFCVSN